MPDGHAQRQRDAASGVTDWSWRRSPGFMSTMPNWRGIGDVDESSGSINDASHRGLYPDVGVSACGPSPPASAGAYSTFAGCASMFACPSVDALLFACASSVPISLPPGAPPPALI